MVGDHRASSSERREPDDDPKQGGTPSALPKPLREGLPVWLTAIVVLVLLGLLGWNIVVVGPEGLGTTYVLGGLLGAYAGVDQLLKRSKDGDR